VKRLIFQESTRFSHEIADLWRQFGLDHVEVEEVSVLLPLPDEQENEESKIIIGEKIIKLTKKNSAHVSL